MNDNEQSPPPVVSGAPQTSQSQPVPAGEGDAYAFAAHLVEQIHGATASAGFHDDRLKPVLHTTVAQYQEKDAELRAVCRSIIAATCFRWGSFCTRW